jgi:hypothetical protein
MISFPLYFVTLAPTFYNLDSAEFAIGVHTLGIVHATGYPLYLVSGHLFTTLVPGSDLGYKLNLFSAIHASLTLMNIVWINKLLSDDAGQRHALCGGLIASLILGFSYYFWACAVIAEVYMFQAWLLTLAVACWLKWERNDGGPWLILLGLAIGLCFANHISVILTLPALGVYFAFRYKKIIQAKRSLLWTILASLIGPIMYVYFPLRYQITAFNLAGHYTATGQFVPIDFGTWQGIWWLLSGQMFASCPWAYSGTAVLFEWGAFLRQFWSNSLGAGVLLGGIGLVSLWRQHKLRLWTLSLVGMMVVHGCFFVNYGAVDKELMFLPVYVLWAILIGVGCSKLLQSTSANRWHLVTGLLLLVPLALVLLNYSYLDVSGDWRARDRAQAFLDQAQPNALVLGWWMDVTPIQYLQYVEDQRTDVQTINILMLSHDDLLQLVQHRITYQPVYLLTPNSELLTLYNAQPATEDSYLLSK